MVLKNQHKRWLLVLLFALFGQGCVVTPSAMPSSAATPLTPKPPIFMTETPSPTPNPTASYTPTPDDIATQNYIATDSVDAVISTVQPELLAEYPSPDGEWRVKLIRYDCVDHSYGDYLGSIAYEQLKLVDLDDMTETVIADQLQNCGGIGAYGLGGLYWSPNSRYFYYTDSREGFPETCGNYVALPIYKLDTVTMEVTIIGGGPLSPDRTRLAMWEDGDIVIWDLDKGEIGRLEGLASDFKAGGIAWSPDSKSLVYLQTEFACAPDYGATYVIILDVEKKTQTLVIKYPPPGFGGVSWEIPEQIALMDGNGKFWIYDLPTREKYFVGDTPFTPTPVPSGIFVLKYYPPLIMRYDPFVWRDESRYTDYKFMVNYLQASGLKTCQIGVIGPSGNFPADARPVQLGNIDYLYSLSETSTPGVTGGLYIENKSVRGYDYDLGLPVLSITANQSEWDRCKSLGEIVLSTLRVP